MASATQDSFGARASSRSAGRAYQIYRLDAVEERASRLPAAYSLKILLENLLRTEDGANITADHIRALAAWDPHGRAGHRDPVHPGPRGDAGLHRRAVRGRPGHHARGGAGARRRPVADQPAGAGRAGHRPLGHRRPLRRAGRLRSATSSSSTSATRERYQFLRWGQTAFDEFKVVPPGTGIVHQVNIEYLARVVLRRATASAYPDTLVGTDSHTTMVNGLGVLGWGVGGIEAEAAMLGQPVSMLIPKVVGFKLTGELPEGATATDLVLTITEMLRKHGVVGKFVEFYGEGVAAVPLANRATIGNMSPEYGSTVAIFPIDDETVRYLRMTGRADEQVALVEAYAKEQGLWHDPDARSRRYSEHLELDLSTVVPSIAGPKRPQDRVSLSDAKAGFRDRAGRLRRTPTSRAPTASTRRRPSRSRPATRPAYHGTNGDRRAARRARPRRAAPAVATRRRSALDGQEFELDHGTSSSRRSPRAPTRPTRR